MLRLRDNSAIPTEYGGQKPPTAQWTVTGAGVALLATNENQSNPPLLHLQQLEKWWIWGLAIHLTWEELWLQPRPIRLLAHFKDRQLDPSYYDLIVTGDLAKIGRETVLELLAE